MVLVADLATGFLATSLAALVLVTVLVVLTSALAGLAVGLASTFLALVAGLTPADLAILARADFLREAVFFFIKSFLTALSYSDWALERFSAVGLVRKSFNAALIFFFSSMLCLVRFSDWRAAFLADFSIGILFLYLD